MMMATINKTMIIPKFNKLEKSWVSSITMKLLINAMIQLSIEQWLNQKITQGMMVTGFFIKILGKVKEDKFGRMVQCMKAGGKIIKLMEKED